MPVAARERFDLELGTARNDPDPQRRWRAAERAHILSQPWPWPHTKVHGLMLRLAVHERDPKEAIGQLIRLVIAGPGSATGRYPEGNTGRTAVGLTEVAPVPDDLRDLLAER